MAPTDDAFFRETKSQIRALNDGLLAVERGDAAVAVAELFRVAHSLKGSCRSRGLDDAGDLAHAIEDVLDALRAGEVDPTADLIDAALDAVDLLEARVRAAAVGSPVNGDAEDVRATLRETLDEARAETSADASGETRETLDDPATGRADPDADWDPADDDLSDEVVAALEETTEFDDLDALLDGMDDPAGDEELDGWGMLDDGATGEESAPSEGSDEEGDVTAVRDADSSPAPNPSETPDEPATFFEQTKAEVEDDADIDDLQEDIDAVEFGEFDEEDNYTIEELLELEPDEDGTGEDHAEPVGEASAASATDADAPPDEEESLTDDALPTGESPNDGDDSVDLPPDLLGVGTDQTGGESGADSVADADRGAGEPPDAVEDESVDDPLGLGDDDLNPAETDDPVGADVSTPVAEDEPDASESDVPDLRESDEQGDDAEGTNTFVFGTDAEDAAAETASPTEQSGTPTERSGTTTEQSGTDPVQSDESVAEPDATSEEAVADSEPGVDSVPDADSLPDDDSLPDFDSVDDSEPVPDAGPAPGVDSVPDADSLPDDDSLPDMDATPDPDSVPETDLDVDLDAEFDADLGDAPERPSDDAVESGMEVSVDDEMAEFESRFGDLLGESSDDEDDEGAVFRSAVATIEESRLETDRFPTGGSADRRDATDEFDRLQAMTVDVDTADELLNVAEELSLTHLRLDEAVGPDTDEAIREEVSNLLRVLTNYRRTVMDVRLMPLETAVETIPRTVRDVARSQDKEVELEVSDADVELDRSIVDRLRDPLVHLARNAVDHGIESPDEREAAGKSRTGTVELSAERVGDEVVVELADDGRGVDPEAVRERAVENGVVTAAEAERLSDDETYDLLFEPGFTTAEEVTDVSGRGVGMDVVNRTVADLNGSVSVDSEPGYGTTVRLRVPVSIALTEVLFVEVEGQPFGVPMTEVEQITAAPPVEEEGGREVVRRSSLDLVGGLPEGVAADDAYPLRRLRSALGLSAGEAAEADVPDPQVVWIRGETGRLALRCDRVVASQEVVVRPYGDLLRDVPGVSGATTLGDGEAVNVLDVGTL